MRTDGVFCLHLGLGFPLAFWHLWGSSLLYCKGEGFEGFQNGSSFLSLPRPGEGEGRVKGEKRGVNELGNPPCENVVGPWKEKPEKVW